jgi:hypothetical protein
MIAIKKKRSGIAYEYIWFAPRPDPLRALGFTIFAQCGHNGPVPGFIRRSFLTKIIDLNRSDEAILKDMARRTATDVKRARRENLPVRKVEDLDEFLAFFNALAPGMGMSRVGRAEFDNWGHETVALSASINGKVVAMHSYIVDHADGRARLLHSASTFRQQETSEDRAAVGRANRALHYEAMLYFKQQGIAKYDVGGFAKDSADPQMANIAKFKDSLGGAEVRESHYVSLPFYALQKLTRMASAASKLQSAGWRRGSQRPVPHAAAAVRDGIPARSTASNS